MASPATCTSTLQRLHACGKGPRPLGRSRAGARPAAALPCQQRAVECAASSKQEQRRQLGVQQQRQQQEQQLELSSPWQLLQVCELCVHLASDLLSRWFVYKTLNMERPG